MLIDSDGIPISGAKVSAGGRNGTTTREDGSFALPDTVGPATMVVISHSNYAERRLTAASLYSDGLPRRVVTAPYTFFEITPRGGRQRKDGITINVPRNAVDSDTTIKIAPLPLSMAHAYDGSMEFSRLAAVDLKPEGLKFAAPLRITVPLAGEPDGSGASISVRNEGSGAYAEEDGTSASAGRGQATLTVDHFSRHVVHRPDRGYRATLLGTGNDRDGDGRITVADVDFMVSLHGGDHTAKINQTVVESTKFFRTRSSSRTNSSGSERTASAGFGMAGVQIDASRTVSEETSKSLGTSTGLETNQQTFQSQGLTQRAPEYLDVCRLYLRNYEFWKVETFERHTPTQAELGAIRDTYNNRRDQTTEWSYMSTPESWQVFSLNHSRLNDIFAVRRHQGRIEVYNRTGQYVARKPIGLDARDCGIGEVFDRTQQFTGREEARLRRSGTDPDSGEGRRKLWDAMQSGYEFFGYGQSLAGSRFSPTISGGFFSNRVVGVGILPGSELERTDRMNETNVECIGGRQGAMSLTSSATTFAESTRKTLETEKTSDKVSMSAKVPLPLDGGLSAGVSGSSSSATSREEAKRFGRKFLSTSTTRIDWSINDPHMPKRVHWSDHMIARLYIVIASRKWDLVDANDLPPAAQNRDDGSLTFVGGKAFLPADADRILMKTRDGKWYLSGPPITEKKPYGLAMIRYAERPCPGGIDEDTRVPLDEDGRDPRESTTVVPNPDNARREREERERDSREERDERTCPPARREGQPRGEGNSTDDDGDCRTLREDIRTYWPNTYILVDPPCPGGGATCGGSAPIGSRRGSATFPRLEGTTKLSGLYIGTPERLQIVSRETTREVEPEGDPVVRTVTNETGISLVVENDTDVSTVIVEGSEGSIVLRREDIESQSPPIVWPIDGAFNIQNGRLRETVSVPGALAEMNQRPEDYWVAVSDALQPLPRDIEAVEGDQLPTTADVLAIRDGTLALQADNIRPDAAADSDLDLQIITPSGVRTNAEVPAWSYEVSAQPVTEVGVPAPIFFQCTGLPQEEVITLNFRPAPWQTIQPLQMQVPCGEVGQPQPVAQYTTERVGPQPIDLTVTRRQ
ncbi:MAG: carboxypeptidase-like regulatory domain-containing protein [Pseudomonadota bacterium]